MEDRPYRPFHLSLLTGPKLERTTIYVSRLIQIQPETARLCSPVKLYEVYKVPHLSDLLVVS